MSELPEYLKPFADSVEDGEGDYPYKDHDGAHYQTAKDLIQSGVLGFCCCGDPDLNLRYIRDGFALIRELSDGCGGVYKSIRERMTAFHGGETQEQFFHYWADEQGYTEHGGAVPGWLEPKGVELLAALQAMDLED